MNLLLFAACYFILVTFSGTSGSSDHERFRRQQQRLTFGTVTEPVNRETFLRISGTRIVSLTGSGARQFDVLGSVECDINNNEVRFIGNGAPVTLTDIQTCYVLANNTLNSFTTTTTLGSDSARAYYDGQSFLYIERAAQPIINFVEAARLRAPRVVEPVSVLVVERADRLVLNIDNTNALNDIVAEATDDTLVLTGSQCRNIESGMSIIYNSDQLNVFTGGVRTMQIPNIEECYVLLIVDGRLDFTQHRGSRPVPPPLSGRGLLCTGESQLSAGQMICFFSEDASVNNQIVGDLVQGQMTFQTSSTMGQVVGALGANDGVNLFSVTESTQVRSFPDAGRIQYNGGVVTINDRFNNVIQQVGTAGSPSSLTYYTGTAIQTFDSSSTTPLNAAITSANGINLAVTGGTNAMVFAYPAGNTFIQNGISTLQNAIPSTPATMTAFSVQSSQFGTINLFADGNLVQEVSTSMSVDISRTQCIIYNSDTVNVYENCDTSMLVNSFGNINTFRFTDSQNVLRTFMGSAPSPVQGPGRFYSSGMSGFGFFTGSSTLNTLIANANNAGARAVVSIMRITNEGIPAAALVTGGTNLFTFDELNTTNIPVQSNGNQGILYSSGTLGIAQTIPVPQGATLQFVGGSAIIQGGPGPDLNVSLSGNSQFVQDFPGSMTYTQVSMLPSAMFPGGGILYTGTNGAVYNRDSRINSQLFMTVESIGGIMETIMQTDLSFFDGRIIRMFSDSASMLLRGPGNIYSNAGRRAFYTTDSTLINRIPSVVSQLVPLIVRYDTDTGDVVITSNNMTTISSIAVDSDRFRIPIGSGMVTVESGVIMFTGSSGNLQTIAMDIDSITLFNGVSATTITTISRTELPVPGSFYIDEMQREAIYITEPAFESVVANTINDAFRTFALPIIPQTTVREVVTREQTVNADFGQSVTTIEGSTVTLRCRAGNANPPAMFTFFQRDRDSQNFTSLAGAANVRVTSDTNEATIEISNVEQGSTEYRCDATNLLGRSTAFTIITGLNGSAPEIQNNFFTGSSTPGTGIVTARSMNPRTIRPIIENSDVDDRSRITNRVLIGCRAKGRATPVISWRTEPARVLNFSSPSLNESRPGPGQSILSVALEPDDVQCVTYICSANNSMGFDEGSATVCPERYVRTANEDQGVCEGDCGIGIREVTAEYNLIREGGPTLVAFANLPAGLVKPDLRFCVLAACPEVTFQFNTTEFSACTRQCNSGTQTRKAICLRVEEEDMMPVSNQECIDRRLQVPELTQFCNEFPCPQFDVGPFSECSRTCRGGEMTRNVSCMMVELDVDGTFNSSNPTFIEVEPEVCFNLSRLEMPSERSPCNSHIPCPVRFATSFGEVCDSFNCQSVSFTCVATDEAVPWPVDDDVCVDQGLVRGDPVRSCGGQVCDFGIWRRTPVGGGCSATCGNGVQMFDVVCRNRTDNMVIIDRYCNGNRRLASVEPCFLENCPGECVNEPFSCGSIAVFGLCKRTDVFPFIPRCCRSCPAQARL